MSETPLTMPEKTWATLFMLMSGCVLFMSGDVKGLLRCPDMAKAKEIPFHFKSDISVFLLGIVTFSQTT